MSQRRYRSWMAVVLLVLSSAACGGEGVGDLVADEPATVEQVLGSDVARITISERAADRLGLLTTELSEAGDLTMVPGGALIVDPEGEVWVYTQVGPMSFVRHRIAIDHQEGDLAYLSEGPAAGVPVVTVGAAELYGIETGIGH